MKAYRSYAVLKKPKWAPPAKLFAPVWAVLYTIIALSYGYVGYLFFFGTASDSFGETLHDVSSVNGINQIISNSNVANGLPFIIFLPFILNLIFNLIFTPLQFGLKNLPLAAIDTILTLCTLIWALVAIDPYISVYPYLVWVTLANIPYLIWVTFATVLQLRITFLNRREVL